MIKNILWDFDGVILDSMPIRDVGFKKIFEKNSEENIDKIINYHQNNGGLSRFHKIKYFYNEILKRDISEEKINHYAEKFTSIMKKELIKEKYLIEDSVAFIKSNYQKYNFHIVSGSEHHELNYLCDKLKLKKYFLSINGSPIPKNSLVEKLLENEEYKRSETILIGDSINDYDAASINGISFYGYNNIQLEKVSKKYIKSFNNLDLVIIEKT